MDTKKGQSLIELAVAFTLLMLLLGGAFEFGTAFFQMVQLRDSAQEGALYGSYCQDISQIESRIKESSTEPLDLYGDGVSIEIKFLDKSGSQINKSHLQEGDTIYVKASYDHRVTMPFLPLVIGNYLYLKGEVTDTILAVKC